MQFPFRPRPSSDIELRELRGMVAAVLRSQAVIEFELDGTIRTANPNFLAVVGHELADIRGRHHSLFMDPTEAAGPDYKSFWQRLRGGEFLAAKFVRYGKGGKRVVIEASYNPIFDTDGKPYKVVKFATDVTATEDERERRIASDREKAEIQTRVVEHTGAGLAAMAQGDLTYRIESDFPGRYGPLRENFNRAIAAMDAAMAVIRLNAGTMQAGAGEISHAADDLARRTEQQAASLEETTTALDEITVTVRKTAENAQAAEGTVTQARNQADSGGEVVQRAIAAMGEIERSSDQISQIIGVIDEIAFQTNLLALNAGVEAARAGDAGRGFAVVASEVRALAQRSADSAREIKTLISASGAQVKDGVVLVRQSGDALTGIVSRISEITQLMGDIRASTQEQASGLAQVNSAINAMDHVTQQNAAMVEQSTAASLNLNREAATLSELVGRFQVSENHDQSRPAPIRGAEARIKAFAAASTPVRSTRPRLAAAGGRAEGGWEEF